MKITAIPQLYRNLKRWREILAVLRRYGLADWLTHFRLPFRDALKDRGGVPLSQYSREQRVRMALTDLGPTFIKLGQVLAARPDLVGPKLGEELKMLRAEVRPDDIGQVKSTLRKELGDDYQTHFQSIDSQPLATASIGQVHRAVLGDGRLVVIKVIRHDIERTMRQDIEVLAGLAQLAERVETLAVWRPREMVRQFAPILQREMDFSRERQNLEHFADMLKGLKSSVVVPRPVSELCTKRVLVMEELVGQSLAVFLRDPKKAPSAEDRPQTVEAPAAEAKPATNQTQPVQQTPPQLTPAELPDAAASSSPNEPRQSTKQRLAKTIARVYMTMLFDEALFHADPHPGNLILMDDGRLGILDFGMIGRIDENLRETIEEMLVAISTGDQNRLTRLIKRIGDPPPTLDESALAIDAAEYLGTYGKQSLGEFDLTGALNELSDILHQHAIKLPNQSALLLKMLISLEGTLRELGASFDSLDVVRSFMRRSMARRLSPKRRFRQARRIYLEAEHFLEVAPDQMIDLLQQARRGEVKISLEHQRLGPTMNRMVLGIMASAVFLGSSLMLANQVPPVLFPDEAVLGIRNLSLMGVIGVCGSITVMMWLLLAINRSGHLTRGNED
jgi:ubiquinone biosynthesis protein